MTPLVFMYPWATMTIYHLLIKINHSSHIKCIASYFCPSSAWGSSKKMWRNYFGQWQCYYSRELNYVEYIFLFVSTALYCIQKVLTNFTFRLPVSALVSPVDISDAISKQILMCITFISLAFLFSCHAALFIYAPDLNFTAASTAKARGLL